MKTTTQPSQEKSTSDLETKLAQEFGKTLCSWLSNDQMKELIVLNATPDYQDGSCASHNYCDANEAMCVAFEKVMGRSFTGKSKDYTMTNNAWSKARKADFYLNDLKKLDVTA